MSSPQVNEIFDRILRAWDPLHDPDKAVEQVRKDLDALRPGLSAALSSEIDQAHKVFVSRLQSVETLMPKHSLRDEDGAQSWYFGCADDGRHWPAVRAHLKDNRAWTDDAIAALDEASTEVVSLLGNPRLAQYSCRGLVVGHVQSGKTANMTAVIAKGHGRRI